MDDTAYTEVEFGPARARVIKDGFYDRFRANPDLAEVAQNPRAGTVDFFLRFPKQQVPSRVGPRPAQIADGCRAKTSSAVTSR